MTLTYPYVPVQINLQHTSSDHLDQPLLQLLTSLSTSNEMSGHVEEPRNFVPKETPKLDPPKDDPISVAELAKHDGVAYQLSACWYISWDLLLIKLFNNRIGTDTTMATWVAIKGSIFDVSGNKAYAPGGAYHRIVASPLHASPFATPCSASSHLTCHQFLRVETPLGPLRSRRSSPRIAGLNMMIWGRKSKVCWTIGLRSSPKDIILLGKCRAEMGRSLKARHVWRTEAQIGTRHVW